jgi:Lon protease-like protein
MQQPMSPLRLPIFPLGLVLFPGARVPLHIFEPRYRRLVADVGIGGRFGVLLAVPSLAERELPPGHVGCIAEVTDVELLPDGRSNIAIVGRERFTLKQFLDDDAPYHVANVEPFADSTSDAPVALVVAGEEVAARFRRVVAAVQTLGGDEDQPPSLPDDPAALPFAIGAMIELELGHQQELLAERSPANRLAKIDRELRKILPQLELGAAMSGPVRSAGRGNDAG